MVQYGGVVEGGRWRGESAVVSPGRHHIRTSGWRCLERVATTTIIIIIIVIIVIIIIVITIITIITIYKQAVAVFWRG